MQRLAAMLDDLGRGVHNQGIAVTGGFVSFGRVMGGDTGLMEPETVCEFHDLFAL